MSHSTTQERTGQCGGETNGFTCTGDAITTATTVPALWTHRSPFEPAVLLYGPLLYSFIRTDKYFEWWSR